MQPVAFRDLNRTVVLSDLHLNMLWGKFEEVQLERIESALRKEDPKTVILNGDTIDLFFGLRDGKIGAEIEIILAENERFITLLRQVPNLYLLAGAHDQALRSDAKICDALRACFPNCKGIHDGLADVDAKIVVVPGVQWYYDNVVHNGTIACLI
jgi:metallophosphoesterase superfamily enzyme